MLQKYYYLLIVFVIICYCVLCTICLKPKTFVDTLERTESFESYDVDCDSCDYVDPDESVSIGTGDLVVMKLNIRGLYSKIDKLKTLLNDCTIGKKISFCCVKHGKVSQAQYLTLKVIRVSINTANIN